MNKWYDKEKNTFSVLTKDSLSVYELDELYNYPKLEIFNFLDVDLVSIKEVWQNSQGHPLYNDACRVIREIEDIFDTVYTAADEHYDELMNHLCHFNDLSKENKRFVFNVNNIATKC